MSVPLNEIPNELYALAAGCVRGHKPRALALLLVVYEDRSEREVAKETGVARTTIQKDRVRFRRTCDQYNQWRFVMKTA